MADVRVDLGTNAEKLIANLREIQRGLGGVNTEVKKVDKSVDELNRELLEQKDVVKDIQAEERRLSALQKKGGKDYSSQLKRVRGDLNVAKTEQRKITEEVKRTVAQQKRSAREADKGSRAFKKLGAAVTGAFAIGTLIRFGKESIKLYDIQAKAEQRLLVALKGRENVQQSLILSAKKLQAATIFGDEEIIAAQSLIAAFTQEEKQIKELTRVTLDFATAKGFDLKSAAELVSKTFASSTNSLTRYGIQVEGAAGSSERLTSIVTALDAAFLGQAESAIVGAGKVEQFGNKVEDLREVLGEKLLPTIELLIDAWTDFLTLTTATDEILAIQTKGILTGAETAEEALNKIIKERKVQAEFIADLELSIENEKSRKKRKQLKEDLENEKLFFNELLALEQTYKNIVIQSRAETSDATTAATNTIGDLKDQLKELRKAQDEIAESDIVGAERQKIAIKDLEDRIKKLTQLNEQKQEQIKLDKAIAEIDDKSLSSQQEVLEFLREQINLIKQRQESKNEELLVDKTNIDQLTNSVEQFGGRLEELGSYPDLISEIGAAFAKNLSAINSFGDIAQRTLSGLAQLNKDNAEYQRNLAIAQILINEILAVANAISSVKAGDPVSYAILAASIAGAVISAFAGIKSQMNATQIPSPGFAEGTPFVDGPGTSKSDSINAWLSKGERVVPADDNKANWKPLEAIRKGEFDKHYFDKQSVIELAKKAEQSKEKGFADNIANSLGMLSGLDSHDDLFNIRGKLGNSNYWLKSIDKKLGNKNKHERR